MRNGIAHVLLVTSSLILGIKSGMRNSIADVLLVTRSAILGVKSGIRNGLETTSSGLWLVRIISAWDSERLTIPADKAVSICSVRAFAVTATIGTCVDLGD
ncbi:unnamed protein product [Sphagnum balticum]